jgi:hypothetical protein
LAEGAEWLRPIPTSRRRSRPGKRLGSTRSSPRVDGWSELGQRGCRRGGSTTAGGGCRGGSGETARRMFCWATRDPWGAIGPRECARELGLQRKRPEEGGAPAAAMAGWRLGGARRGEG